MGLLDQLQSFGQGASNSAASTVTAPVDGLAWLLRKMGVPVPSDPVGGSDWAAKQGLTATPKNHTAGLLGEAFGGIAPIVAAAKAPQIARGLLQAGENAMAPRTLNPQTGAIVWHGSPHKFDKFDASKIGTGEGAQAYGHGLYLAENPKVASEYLMPDKAGFEINGQYLQDLEGPTAYAAKLLSNGGGEPLARISQTEALFSKIGKLTPEKQAYMNETRKEVERLRNADIKQASSLYKVDLPDEHIAKMLDWDKPLSQQHPDVQKMLEPLGYSTKAQVAQYEDDLLASLFGDTSKTLGKINDPMGSDIARGGGLFDGKGQVEKAKRLQELGIPGIRYLDGGSRGAGAGYSNFVVFPGNEGLLSILERNGQSLK